MTEKKPKGIAVFMDSELALALNRLREEVRQQNETSGIPGMVPTLGWLARHLLREKLGLTGSKAATQDKFTQL